jgi:hypothetical protein
MADRLPALGDYVIPSDVIDRHEWMTDSLIDGELGSTCTLTFPAKSQECDNCVYDTYARRSSNIYKTGGPIPFTSHNLCPRCQGRGLLSLPVTQTIRLRVYWEPRAWREIGVTIADPQGLCMVLGYMADLPDLEKAHTILVNDELRGIRNYECVRSGEAQPWGFRRNRYFRQMLKRNAGG